MRVLRSNRIEQLASELARACSQPLSSPFARETIVVQSKGMERWLSLRLSSHFGVWANAEFPFPRSFIERLFDAVVPQGTNASAYGRHALKWTLLSLLAELEGAPELSEIRSYLSPGASDVRALELCERIAHAFDQYAVYRPDLLLSWETEDASGFQAFLWRHVVRRHGSCHVAARAKVFLETWPSLSTLPASLPERVAVFGISSLPPLFVQIFAALSKRVPVDVFCLTPVEAWPPEGEGPALCDAFGRLGREFSEVLDRHCREANSSTACFEAPGASSLLSALQSDLLSGRRRGPVGHGLPALPVRSGDDSILVHSCHSPMREVEVLRDRLLDYFERDPTLAPHDVIVMMPDVETYAPLVEAVFGAGRLGEPGCIPYRIADRTVRADNAVADSLIQLLRVLPGRLRSTELLDLLEHDAVRRRFGIEESEVPTISTLVQKSGIRWGRDREHRVAVGQPDVETNTWRFGLRRLLLGYAMPAHGYELYAGTLPHDRVEGEIADLVGRLAHFAETIFACQARLSAPRAVAAWVRDITSALADLTATDERTDWQARAVRQTLADFAAEAELARFDGLLSLEAVTALLSSRYLTERTTHDFLSGGVTFCALLPMRSIPFRLVYLLGMNDAGFPRADRPVSFDKTLEKRVVGDRSARDEDKYLFLEALLSARERFCVSYVGHSAHDNAVYPPSVVVSDLQAILGASFVESARPDRQLFLFEDTAGRPPSVLVNHPLQPWSRKYFEGDPHLFSYSEADAAAANALHGGVRAQRRFHRERLEADEVTSLSLEELVRFLENPARSLLQRQLGVRFDDEPDRREDREPAEMNELDKWEVGTALLEERLSGKALDEALLAVRARGVLPLGTPGELAFGRVLPTVLELAEACDSWVGAPALAPIDVELDLGPVLLRGALRDVFPRALVRRQFSRVRAKTLLGVWVQHLALQCSAPGGHPRLSVVVGRPEDDRKGKRVHLRVFEPMDPEAASGELTGLVDLYQRGQKLPLCLFPTVSLRYVETLHRKSKNGAPHERALEDARRTFARLGRREGEDEYVKRLFTDVDAFVDGAVPFDEDGAAGMPSFAEAAKRVFEPLLAHSRTEET